MPNSLILKDLIEKLNLSIYQFERQLGVGASTINKAIQRNTKLKADMIEKISKTFPSVNIGWLKTGKGEMFVHEADEKKDVHTPINNNDTNIVNDELTKLLSSSSSKQNAEEDIPMEERYLRMAEALSRTAENASETGVIVARLLEKMALQKRDGSKTKKASEAL